MSLPRPGAGAPSSSTLLAYLASAIDWELLKCGNGVFAHIVMPPLAPGTLFNKYLYIRQTLVYLE